MVVPLLFGAIIGLLQGGLALNIRYARQAFKPVVIRVAIRLAAKIR